tara:strand:+ start:1138 stop:1368 length:231 start_codon:yes stop_codon:yes gene_type:complete
MNPQFLFNSSLALFTAGLIFFFKGLIPLGIGSFCIALGSAVIWLMSGLFEKFESTPPEIESLDDKDEEGKGVLKPF